RSPAASRACTCCSRPTASTTPRSRRTSPGSGAAGSRPWRRTATSRPRSTGRWREADPGERERGVRVHPLPPGDEAGAADLAVVAHAEALHDRAGAAVVHLGERDDLGGVAAPHSG